MNSVGWIWLAAPHECAPRFALETSNTQRRGRSRPRRRERGARHPPHPPLKERSMSRLSRPRSGAAQLIARREEETQVSLSERWGEAASALLPNLTSLPLTLISSIRDLLSMKVRNGAATLLRGGGRRRRRRRRAAPPLWCRRMLKQPSLPPPAPPPHTQYNLTKSTEMKQMWCTDKDSVLEAVRKVCVCGACVCALFRPAFFLA